MKTKQSVILRNPMLPFVVVALLASGCSGCGSGSAGTSDNAAASGSSTDMTVSPADESDRGQGGVNMASDADGASDAATGDRYNAVGVLDPAGNYGRDGAVLPGVVLTPVEERTDAIVRMNGIRSTLMAELEEVRATLKDGTVPKEQAAQNQTRAAELAQGLERVDRTLAAMGGATDATWSEMRAAELKEVEEVRTWWNKYMAGQSERASQ